MNGLYIVGVILGFYFLIILLLLSESFANKILPIYSYKLLSLKARFLKLYSLLTLFMQVFISYGGISQNYSLIFHLLDQLLDQKMIPILLKF